MTQSFTSKEADKLLKKELPKIEKEVKHYAHDLAEDSLPKIDDPASRYVPTIQNLCQSLLESILLILQATSVILEGKNLNLIFSEKEKNLKQRIRKLQQDIRVTKRGLRELGEDLAYRVRRWKIALIALACLTVADIIANYQFFEIYATTKIMALAVASGLALGIFLLAHQTKRILNLTRRKERKVLAFIGMMMLMTVVFYTVGSLRLIYGEAGPTQSPWPVVVINLFLFIVSALLVYFYSVSTTDKIKWAKQNEIKQKIKQLESDHDLLKEELEKLPEEKHKRLMELYRLLQLAKHYENRVASEYHKLFQFFCRENRLMRKDGAVPSFFSDEIPPLKTYFTDIV